MKKLTATILSMSVLTVMAGAAIAPALDIIGAHFSQAGVHEMTIKLIVSFPALFIILTNLFFHTVSRRLSTKTIALLGLTVYILCGAGCYLTDNIVMLLLLRALLGVSVGLLMPLSTGLLAYYFAPEEQAADGLVGSHEPVGRRHSHRHCGCTGVIMRMAVCVSRVSDGHTCHGISSAISPR